MGFLDPNSPEHSIFMDLIQGRVYAHHAFYDEARVSDTIWEETISRCLHAMDIDHKWRANSHEVGTDIRILGDVGQRDVTISVKSGKYDDEKKLLQFSGSRLGKYKQSINAMHEHIVQTQSDYYLFAAGPPKQTKKQQARSGGRENRYSIFVVPRIHIDYGTPNNWHFDNKLWRYDSDTLEATIRPSMSHQLWTTLKIYPQLGEGQDEPHGLRIAPALVLRVAKQFQSPTSPGRIANQTSLPLR